MCSEFCITQTFTRKSHAAPICLVSTTMFVFVLRCSKSAGDKYLLSNEGSTSFHTMCALQLVPQNNVSLLVPCVKLAFRTSLKHNMQKFRYGDFIINELCFYSTVLYYPTQIPPLDREWHASLLPWALGAIKRPLLKAYHCKAGTSIFTD